MTAAPRATGPYRVVQWGTGTVGTEILTTIIDHRRDLRLVGVRVPKPKDGWTLTIEGDPSMQVHFISLASFSRPAGIEEHVRSASVATAMQALNAVPAVCAAEPGFATMATLPLIRGCTGFARRAGAVA